MARFSALKKRFVAPALPAPTQAYEVQYFDRFVSILRLYFNQLDNTVGGVSGVAEAGTAAPTTGMWEQGDTLRNSNTTELGSPGARYVLMGWVCVAGGEPGTWREMRVLTGN